MILLIKSHYIFDTVNKMAGNSILQALKMSCE